MTEIEQLRAENETLRRQLQSSQDQSRAYLQNVAHQLTAPLGAIKWSIEALRDQKVPLVRKGNLLSSVYSQATILVHLIKNFALMSNLDADQELGQMRNQIQVDVTRLAINLANDFQPQAREVEKSVDVDDASFLRVLGVHNIFGEKNLIAQAISITSTTRTVKSSTRCASASSTVPTTSVSKPLSPRNSLSRAA
jgi:K+-sensing histidine kinase KdpD